MLLPTLVNLHPHAHRRVRSTASYTLSTNFPDVQPADGSGKGKRLLFDTESLLRPSPVLSTGVYCWVYAGKPRGVGPQGQRKKRMVKISWLMS